VLVMTVAPFSIEKPFGNMAPVMNQNATAASTAYTNTPLYSAFRILPWPLVRTK
jgi:hypothetical protein